MPKLAGTPQTEATEPFTVILSPELKNALFKRAQVEDRSAASVARNALRAFLGEPNGGQTKGP